MDIEDLMDVPDVPRPERVPRKKEKEKRGFTSGAKFTTKEEDFVREHYESMTDKQMARELGRTKKSIESYRSKKGLQKSQGQPGKPKSGTKNRRAFLATLDDEEKQAFLTRELKASALYRTLCESYQNAQNYIRLYEQKYIEFMMDPTIETVTSMERDIWHEMTLAQIREMEYLKKEKDDPPINEDGMAIVVNYAKEIAQCQETIRKCQESLGTERRQRLKSGSDQGVSFTSIIKELRHPDHRRKAGEAAAMLKYIAEKHYNTRLGKNIISGSDEKYDLNTLFKDGKEPEDLDGDFTGEKELDKSQSAIQAGEAIHAD